MATVFLKVNNQRSSTIEGKITAYECECITIYTKTKETMSIPVTNIQFISWYKGELPWANLP